MWLRRRQTLYRPFHAPQSVLHVFIRLLLAAVLCVIGDCQTQIALSRFSCCQCKTPCVDGGVDHRLPQLPPQRCVLAEQFIIV